MNILADIVVGLLMLGGVVCLAETVQKIEETFINPPHTHVFNRSFFDHVPLNDPPTFHHTSMYVDVCATCPAWRCFPSYNRGLVSPGSMTRLRTQLELDADAEILDTTGR